MIKKLVSLVTIFTLLFTSLVSFNSYAVNEKECSIWLCLPTGFPSGCGDAFSAFKKRIKKGKSPLPDLGSCLVETGTATDHKISAYQGPEIQIIPHRECVRWSTRNSGRDNSERYCSEYKDIPAQVLKIGYCPLPSEYSNFCIRRNLVEVYDNKVLIGNKFYY